MLQYAHTPVISEKEWGQEGGLVTDHRDLNTKSQITEFSNNDFTNLD